MITNIQYLRAFAALGVVLYHSGFVIIPGVHTQFSGVALFFCISGFIMTYISRDDQKNFFINRCIRIVPLYTLVTLFVFFFQLRGLSFPGLIDYLSADSGAMYGLTLENLLKSLCFIPYKNHAGNFHPINGVGWTLNYEMYFYLVFSIALSISRKLAPGICIALLVLVKVLVVGSPSAVHIYGEHYIYFFISGICLFYLWTWYTEFFKENNTSLVRYTTYGYAVIVFVCYIVFNLQKTIDTDVRTQLILVTLAVSAALFLHSCGLRGKSRLLLALGNASYSLYLTHAFLIDQVRVYYPQLHPRLNVGTLSLCIVACSLLAVGLYYGFELPANGFLRKTYAHAVERFRLVRGACGTR